MRRVRAIVSGNVQRVGYRFRVATIARLLGVKGYVKNLEDGNVEIVAEGEEISRFLDEIKIRKPPIYVEDISISEEQPTGEFRTFKIVTGSLEEEMVEGFGTGAMYLELLLDGQNKLLEGQNKLLEGQNKLLEGQEKLLEGQEKLLEKQEKLIEGQEKLIEGQEKILKSQERLLEGQEKLKDELSGMRSEVVSELKSMRGDLRSVFDERLRRLEEDMAKVKARLGVS